MEQLLGRTVTIMASILAVQIDNGVVIQTPIAGVVAASISENAADKRRIITKM